MHATEPADGAPPHGPAAADGAAADGAAAVDGGLAAGLLRWATGGARAAEVRGLRDGGSPWRIRLEDGTAVVLRTGGRDPLATEATALELCARSGVPAPRLLDADLDADPPRLLVTLVEGSSAIPAERPAARLRTLGAAAAALHAVEAPGMPERDRPIAVVDFRALRRTSPARPLLVEAEERLAGMPVPGAVGFTHGDLWQGNAMWSGDALAGLVDWDCAGSGPAGVDLGSLRCDAAVCFGVPAADDVLAGWEDAAGRPAEDVPYWDVVAALATPPDMDWFTDSMAGQGRADLTRQLLLARRDAYLRAALDRL